MYGVFALLRHSLLIRIITEGKNNALGYLLHWLDWGETRKYLALQCRTQWSTLKFCGCDLNLKTFNNMQQVPWFLFSANRNYILFLNLLICQPHRHVSFWTTFVLTASQWLQSILIIVKRAHKEGFLDCLNYDVSFHAILWGALPWLLLWGNNSNHMTQYKGGPLRRKAWRDVTNNCWSR